MPVSARFGIALLVAGLTIPLIFLPNADEPRGTPDAPGIDYAYTVPLGYVCYRARTPVVIDGKLDDAAWNDAPWTADFVDIEGDRKPRPRRRTRVKMLWDAECLYIAAELEEPHVWATLIKHDSVIFHDNDFEVFLDPDGDRHLYGELELNALNTTWDLLLPKPYKDQGGAIDAWEIMGLRTAVHVDGTLNDPRDTDRGWSVEMAWPWRGVKELTAEEFPLPPRDGDRWRINFSRVEWRHEVVDGKYRKVAGTKEDNWVWSPQGVIDMHRPERWGFLQFSTAPPGSAKLALDPAEPTRLLLQRVHCAQLGHRKAHGRLAPSLGALGLAELARSVRFEKTSTSYEASAAGPGGRWHINGEGRLWAEGK